MFIDALAMVLSVHLIRNYAEGTLATHDAVGAHRGVAAALSFIRAHYAEAITLADIAEAASMSTFHLSRMFKRTLGMSPHQYLIDVRVHSANALLSAGAEGPTLAEVATVVGFADQSHLTRRFKRILGTTPKKARR